MATTFVPGSEPLDMLEATVQALVALDYPHDTWVLDEGDDDAVKEVCRKYGALHFSRKHFPRYQKDKGTYCRRTKYGNYNAWLTEIGFDRYDILTAFDPDHLPERHFLTQVLGYFDDPHVGYVQAAQAYGNQHQSWIARGAAEETYDYFSTIQMASYGMGYPVIVGGHNTHRMAALREVGGFAAHDADDILITLLYRDAGWRGVYVPQILARGQTPSEWPAYLIQQRRWARSVLDIKLRTYPSLAGRAPLPTRAISFVHGFNYLARGLLPALVLGLLCVLCISNTALQALAGVSALPVLAALATLTLSELFRQRFFLDPRREWGLHWRAAVLRWARWPQMILALQDVILDRHPPYSITAKSKGGTAGFAWLWPHLMAAVIVIAFWGVGVVKGEITHPAAHLLVAGVLVSTLAMCTSGCLALCVFARRIRTVFRL